MVFVRAVCRSVCGEGEGDGEGGNRWVRAMVAHTTARDLMGRRVGGSNWARWTVLSRILDTCCW